MTCPGCSARPGSRCRRAGCRSPRARTPSNSIEPCCCATRATRRRAKGWRARPANFSTGRNRRSSPKTSAPLPARWTTPRVFLVSALLPRARVRVQAAATVPQRSDAANRAVTEQTGRLLTLADARMKQGRLAGSADAAEAYVLAAAGHAAEAAYRLGEMAADAGNDDDAGAYFERAARLASTEELMTTRARALSSRQ